MTIKQIGAMGDAEGVSCTTGRSNIAGDVVTVICSPKTSLTGTFGDGTKAWAVGRLAIFS
jgi:hypothetical protein